MRAPRSQWGSQPSWPVPGPRRRPPRRAPPPPRAEDRPSVLRRLRRDGLVRRRERGRRLLALRAGDQPGAGGEGGARRGPGGVGGWDEAGAPRPEGEGRRQRCDGVSRCVGRVLVAGSGDSARSSNATANPKLRYSDGPAPETQIWRCWRCRRLPSMGEVVKLGRLAGKPLETLYLILLLAIHVGSEPRAECVLGCGPQGLVSAVAASASAWPPSPPGLKHPQVAIVRDLDCCWLCFLSCLACR